MLNMGMKLVNCFSQHTYPNIITITLYPMSGTVQLQCPVFQGLLSRPLSSVSLWSRQSLVLQIMYPYYPPPPPPPQTHPPTTHTTISLSSCATDLCTAKITQQLTKRCAVKIPQKLHQNDKRRPHSKQFQVPGPYNSNGI